MSDCSGNRTSLLLQAKHKLVIEVQIDGTSYMASVDSGHSCLIKSQFVSYGKENVDVLTVNRKTKCCESINLGVCNVISVKFDDLRVDRKSLGFSFILRINTIKW